VNQKKEYKELLQLILEKSGRDLKSMSESQKIILVNTLNKVYKAKEEGKLKNYEELNEISLLRLLRPFGIYFVSKWIGGVLGKISDWYDFKDQKLEKYVIEMGNQLQKDKKFIQKIDSMIGPDGITSELVDRVVKLPEVQTQFDKYKNDKDITREELEKAFKVVLLAAAKDNGYAKSVSDSASKNI
jgi:hypothetical protein